MQLNYMFYALAGRRVSAATPSITYWMCVHHVAAFLFRDIPPLREKYADDWEQHRNDLLNKMLMMLEDRTYYDLLHYDAPDSRGPWPFPLADRHVAPARAALLREHADPVLIRRRHPALLDV